MSSWSIPVKAVGGWKLRVLSGTSIGQEFDLPLPRYVLGSQAPANIVIPDPSIAPQHVQIELRPDHVYLSDCSRGRGMQVNGKSTSAARLVPGDQVTVGTFRFQFTNPTVTIPLPATPASQVLGKFLGLPLYVRVGLITGSLAITLYVLLVSTLTPTLVPVTLLSMSAVVPATLICFLVGKYDRKGISFQTLALTFLAGGTVGVVSAMFSFLAGGALTGGLLLLPVFAGIVEEPAKLLGTAWRWRHPRYDHPLDGLILGTVSGLGFAVFETAGYGFTALASGQGGLQRMLSVLITRSLMAPFGHGLWSGILAAGFWQCNRDWKRAFHSRVFGVAAAWAVGLHCLWNLGASLDFGWLLTVLSASLSVREYRKLLQKNGYRPG